MKAYFVGGGIGALAGAAFLLRDAGMVGGDIVIYEKGRVAGGSLDGQRLPDGAYSLRGGRMLTSDHYECTWDLLSSIPSLQDAQRSVFEQTLEFNREHVPHSRARLLDRNRHKVDVRQMGFTMQDRIELLRLMETSEDKLADSPITDWLSPGFFQTNFWLMWQTTFAFQPWHSAVELKRYLHRFINEFPRIETLAGVKRTVFNQYDAIVLPLLNWLQQQGVQLICEAQVSDLELCTENGRHRVASLEIRHQGQTQRLMLAADDLVFLQNGSMTDASSLGSMTSPAPALDRHDSQGWQLWEKLAQGRPEFGRPAAFTRAITESCWQSFTVTCRDPGFFQAMEAFTGNVAGTGGLVTFKDSNWLMSVVLYHQPHFVDQPADVQVFWGYALYPDRVGNFVAKPMADCGGAELLTELCGHLRFDRRLLDSASCIPCRMPYITSMFMTRHKQDRPLPVPANSTNLAFISQFVEIADDVVFTVEYSVRAAQMAVYQLLGIKRPIPPITRHDRSLKVLIDSLEKAFS